MTLFTLRGAAPSLRNPSFLADRGSISDAPPAGDILEARRPVETEIEIEDAPVRLVAPWPANANHSTESRLAAIGAGVGTAEEEWVRGLVEQVDRRGQRDAAVRAAAALVDQGAISTVAKSLESELRGYLSRAWPRERDRGGPDPDCSALRRQLFRIGKLTDGAGLGWRRILDLIEN